MNAVTFQEPMPVTNAACCSNGHVMCPKCAAKALAAVNQSHGFKPEPLTNMLPTWDFEMPTTKAKPKSELAAHNGRQHGVIQPLTDLLPKYEFKNDW